MADVDLVIDGWAVRVPAGTTVLEAARSAGIRIPTLCHVDGFEPSASCFLCTVQVEGQRTLSPSCALPVAPGMVVTTDSDDIRASRKMALELLLSDHAGDCVAPCSAGCPAGLDIASFVFEIASGDPDRAMEILHRRLALPGALGRICPRLCEQSCRRCEREEEGLAIAALHRWATDRNREAGHPVAPRPGPSSGKRVAIVGAGPAGLSAAFYLLQLGHACTLHDAHPEPGGMLRYGIPEYRLPRAALDDECAAVARLGARFRMGVRWGLDFHLADLRRDHDAVFLAVGAPRARGLDCEGEPLAISGLDFLERVALGETPALGRTVAVIGGGNTAMDAARSARRMGCHVIVLYRRTREEMPCLMDEVDGAEEEGVELRFRVAPIAIRAGDAGSRLTIVCRRMEPGPPDASGRRRPVPVEGTEFTVDCDTAIGAVGQSVDVELAMREGVPVNDHGIEVDAATLATPVPGVFAGGDVVLGADVAVRAVAAGRVAAVSIDQFLRGDPVVGPRDAVSVAMKPLDDDERAALFRQIERSDRVGLPTLPLERRLESFDEVEGGLDDERARVESTRCMSCNCRGAEGCSLRRLATELGADPSRFLGSRRRFEQDASHPDILFEPGKCILCGACERVAAEAGEPLGLTLVGRGFEVSVGVPFGGTVADGLTRSATRVAEVCPTGAFVLRTARSCDLACGGCPASGDVG